MDRDAGQRKIVVADGMHAHHREETTNIEQLLSRAKPDSTVTFDTKSVDFTTLLEPRAHLGIGA